MELPSKTLEQLAFDNRPKIEKHMFFVLDRTTHEEILSQPLVNNFKQLEIAVTFLTHYKSIFKVTSKNIKIYLTTSNGEEKFSIIIISQEAYEIDQLNSEIKRVNEKENFSTEENCPLLFKPYFLILDSNIEIKPFFLVSQVSFIHDGSLRDLLGLDPVVFFEN